tara:strand:- start:118 stop:726 length:609 start_codon:yes stop_codon:yes gene_type:complete
MAKRILIAGDSFGCEWPKGEGIGWPLILAENHAVNNLAQAGVGEYKILKQLHNLSAHDPYWVNNYDCVIVCHTSPSRIHTPKHPVHKQGLHKDCDLIYSDVANKFDWFNSRLRTAKNWFYHHYDDEYQKDLYKIVREEINRFITIPYLAVDNFSISNQFASERHTLDLTDIWSEYRGVINHYTPEGNQIVLKQIIDKLEKIC